jgi:hypothetical protein
MNLIKTLSLSILCVALAFAADVAADKPNPAVEKAMSASLSDADKAYSAYKAALVKATDKAVASPETAKKDALKKGDLDTANAVEAKIKDLKAGALEGLEADRSKLTADLLGDKPEGDTFLGKWKIAKNSDGGHEEGKNFTFAKDGTWTSPWRDMTGRWSNRNGKLTMTSSGYSDFSAAVTNDGITIKFTHNGAVEINLTKEN